MIDDGSTVKKKTVDERACVRDDYLTNFFFRFSDLKGPAILTCDGPRDPAPDPGPAWADHLADGRGADTGQPTAGRRRERFHPPLGDRAGCRDWRTAVASADIRFV